MAVLLWGTPARACNVPVFRYALERWEADPYELVIFHRAPLAPEQQAWLERMEKTSQEGRANLNVSLVDASKSIPPPLQTLWETRAETTLPWIVLRYPHPTRIEAPAWAGPWRPDLGDGLVESPARQDLARRLLRGDATVWLLLESGNKQKDEQVAQRVEDGLRELERTLALPEPSPLDPPMTLDLPLKIAFSTLRVRRDDPAERFFVQMLLNFNTNRTAASEPMLFPIFGRGRAIPPAIGREIQAEALRDMAEFLTGPCSCEIKGMNPGFDLLLAANWKSLPSYSEVALPEPPPLVGMSQFASGATNPARAAPARPVLATAAATPPPAEAHPLRRNLAVVLALGVAAVALATLALRARAKQDLG